MPPKPTLDQTLELISFDVCPFVQRSVITLRQKKVDFKITFIDLDNPPEWFNEISPLGKVPVLIVRQQGSDKKSVLFESSVINEYVDEITPPKLMPDDPLAKAHARAWFEVGSELLRAFSGATLLAKDQASRNDAEIEFFDVLDQVEKVLPGGAYFNGKSFTLVDSTFAPVFSRAIMFPQLMKSPRWSKLGKVRQWMENLNALPSVRESLIPEFKERMRSVMKEYGSIAANELV